MKRFDYIIQRLRINDPDLKHLDLTFKYEYFDDEKNDSDYDEITASANGADIANGPEPLPKFILNKQRCTLLLDALENNTYCHSMDCSHKNLGDAVIQLLAKIPNFKKLNLSNNQITDQGAQELAKSQTLSHLDLSNNKITDLGAQELAKSQTLRHLNLSENQIGFLGAESLSKNLHLDTLILRTSSIEHIRLGDRVAINFARNSSLKYLDLTNWRIGVKGAKALAQNQFLDTLILNNNPITDEGAIYFIFSEINNDFATFFSMLKNSENINQQQMRQFLSTYSPANNNIKNLSLMNVAITDIGAFILT